MTLAAEPLTPDHQVADFSSGEADLDQWLSQSALAARAQGTRTYVLVDPPSVVALGYFAIAPHLIRRDDLGRPFGRGMPGLVPAVLLAKLALAEELQGAGLGSELLMKSLRLIISVARSAGGKVVVVDAIDDEAAAFYRAHDFTPLPGNDRRLVLKLSRAARELRMEWP